MDQTIQHTPYLQVDHLLQLIRNYYADDSTEKKNTGVCLIVYMQPLDRVAEATEEFIDIYSEKGRILV